MNLSEVKVGRGVTIKEINVVGKDKQRLIEIGFNVGEKVFVKRLAPLNDPIMLKIKDFTVAMRKADARLLIVE